MAKTEAPEDLELNAAENTDEVVAVEELETEDTIEESAASETLKPNSMPAGAANKTAALGKIVDAFASMSHDDVNKFWDSIAKIGHEGDVNSGKDAGNKATIKAKPSGAVGEEVESELNNVIREDLTNIFEGETLTEEFKDRVSTLFESAVNLRVAAKTVELEEAYEARIDEEMEVIAENLATTMDEYLKESVSDWLGKNEVAIESSLRNELADEFMDDLRDLLEKHYIDIPEDKLDLLDDMAKKVDELETVISKKIEENIDLTKQIEKLAIAEALKVASEGLSESEVEKLGNLSESVEYKDVEDFSKKIGILKENYFGEKAEKINKPEVLFEEVEEVKDDEEKVITGPMAAYVRTISQNLNK